jgi:hypothetical protein
MVNQPFTENNLRIIETNPYPSQSGVAVNAQITIKANSPLNLASIEPSVRLVKANSFTADLVEDHFDDIFEKTVSIECLLTFSNNKMEINMEPRSFLSVNTKYLLLINGLKDVFGSPQTEFYYAFFDTDTENINPGSELVFPADRSIIADMPEFKWLKQPVNEYIIQISASPTFGEILLEQSIRHTDVEEAINTVQITPSLILDENTYYWRVRAVPGVWSTVNSFYYQPVNVVPVTKEDIVYRDAAVLDYLNQNEIIEVTENNISDYLVNVNKVIYLKLNKHLDPESIIDIIFVRLPNNDEEELVEMDFDYSVIHTLDPEGTYIVIYPIKEQVDTRGRSK